jgi:hypothetical protein
MSTKTDNVISFPVRGKFVDNPPEPPISNKDVADGISQVKFNHINETLATVIPMLFTNLELAGFDFSVDEEEDQDYNVKDGSFIVESVRSMLCKFHDIRHPFQDIAEAVFIKDDEDGSFAVTKNLNLVLEDYDEKGTSES